MRPNAKSRISSAFRKQIGQEWEKGFDRFLDFVDKYGNHRRIRPSLDPELSAWSRAQQQMRRLGMLSEDRIARLESAGFMWYCGGNRFCWEYLYKQLSKFQAHHGHCRVPYSLYKEQDEDLGYLAMWVHCLRVQYKENRLAYNKQQALEAIGFDWGRRGVSPLPWDVMYQRLAEYTKRHGHPNVKPSEDKRLHQWLGNQKGRMKAQRPQDKPLTATQLGKLHLLGVYADTEVKWEEGYRRLAMFQAFHGHCFVPKDYEVDPRLARWFHRKANSLSRGDRRDRVFSFSQWSMLAELGADYAIARGKWLSMPEGLRRLRKFIAKHGHANVPRDIPLDQLFANWFYMTRRKAERGSLSPEDFDHFTALAGPIH